MKLLPSNDGNATSTRWIFNPSSPKYVDMDGPKWLKGTNGSNIKIK